MAIGTVQSGERTENGSMDNSLDVNTSNITNCTSTDSRTSSPRQPHISSPQPAHLAYEKDVSTHSRNASDGSKYSDSSSSSGYTAGQSLDWPSVKLPAQATIKESDLEKGFAYTPVTNSTSTLNDEKSESSNWDSKEKFQDYSGHIVTSEQLQNLVSTSGIPPLTGSERWRNLRYNVATVYRRLWALVILANLAVIAGMIYRATTPEKTFTYSQAATATGANLLATALMRHEHSVNLLFKLACSIPNCAPLAIRRHAAKVYCYGGVHSGCGISAFMWYIFYTVLILQQFKGGEGAYKALAATCAGTLVLFSILVSLAYPTIRARWHDYWELSHRFGGWLAVALVWAQVLIITIANAQQSPRSTGITLITNPTFWFLCLITLCLIYPWLRLRRRAVTPEVLSSHATRLHFDDTTLRTCVAYRLSHRPLLENHGFATIPNAGAKPGYSILVSHAGDWTRSMIDSPPTHVWTRGAPTTGVMRIATLFKPIIVIATGSGIGPCLSFLQCFPDYPMRVIWSARDPPATYGSAIMSAVLRADPRALIIDTNKTKRPDMVGLAWALKDEVGAEAAVCISNPKVTKMVTSGLEMRGFPAFGAVFDS